MATMYIVFKKCLTNDCKNCPGKEKSLGKEWVCDHACHDK